MRYLQRHVKIAGVLSKRYLEAEMFSTLRMVLVLVLPQISWAFQLLRPCVGGRKSVTSVNMMALESMDIYLPQSYALKETEKGAKVPKQ